ncbi:hypothetical protein B9G55_14785 [Saccharibacillus sp. O16]|nr:hypothetical protein B9G55_14785 [Saccharibacillus sp. O16]
MNLRAELLPRRVSAQKREEIERAIGEIEDLLEQGEDQEGHVALEAFNARYGQSYQPDDFCSRAEELTQAEWAWRIAQPPIRRIADITREELIEIVRRIQQPEHAAEQQREDEAGEAWSEGMSFRGHEAALQDFYLELLEAQVAMPDVSDLIFWNDLEPEEVVDRALAYQPIILPPG